MCVNFSEASQPHNLKPHWPVWHNRAIPKTNDMTVLLCNENIEWDTTSENHQVTKETREEKDKEISK